MNHDNCIQIISYIFTFIYIYEHIARCPLNLKNWKNILYHTFYGILTISLKSKKIYKCLSLSTKRQGIMYDRKRKTCQFTEKRKKVSRMSRVWVKLFNMYFLIKNLIKTIKIHLKKESIKIYIFFNTTRFF